MEDLLPPFSALTTDEERERKAELQDPGTYHVVANLSSFVALPEYRDQNTPTPDPGDGGGYGSPDLAGDEDDTFSRLSFDPASSADDPNVVILRVFEDSTRKGPIQPYSRSTANPTSPASSQVSAATTSRPAPHPHIPHTDGQHISMLDVARNGGRDAQLLQHYRTSISPYILRAQRPEGEEDIFEVHARSYPPVRSFFWRQS